VPHLCPPGTKGVRAGQVPPLKAARERTVVGASQSFDKPFGTCARYYSASPPNLPAISPHPHDQVVLERSEGPLLKTGIPPNLQNSFDHIGRKRPTASLFRRLKLGRRLFRRPQSRLQPRRRLPLRCIRGASGDSDSSELCVRMCQTSKMICAEMAKSYESPKVCYKISTAPH
jgi:hypothetical protein